MLAEVQGDLGRVLQARALEDPTLCVLVGRRYLTLGTVGEAGAAGHPSLCLLVLGVLLANPRLYM